MKTKLAEYLFIGKQRIEDSVRDSRLYARIMYERNRFFNTYSGPRPEWSIVVILSDLGIANHYRLVFKRDWNIKIYYDENVWQHVRGLPLNRLVVFLPREVKRDTLETFIYADLTEDSKIVVY